MAADNSPRFAQDAGAEINEYCDDAVCEICCSVITQMLDDGKKTALIYNDTHSNVDRVERKQFDGGAGFEEFLPYFAACVPDKPLSAGTLLDFTDPETDNDLILVTSRLTGETVAALREAKTANRAVSVVLFEPYAMTNDPGHFKDEAETYVQELVSANVNVQRVSEAELI